MFKRKNNEKYIIANLKTPRNSKGNRLGKYYVDYFYTGKSDRVSYDMDWGYQKIYKKQDNIKQNLMRKNLHEK